MKKLVLVLLSTILFSNSGFAMGGKPSPLAACVTAKSVVNCNPIYGDPWNPNYKYPAYIVVNGQLVLNVNHEQPFPICESPKKICTQNGYQFLCPCYDPSKLTYDPAGYIGCQNIQMTACKAEGVK